MQDGRFIAHHTLNNAILVDCRLRRIVDHSTVEPDLVGDLILYGSPFNALRRHPVEAQQVMGLGEPERQASDVFDRCVVVCRKAGRLSAISS